MIADNVSDRPTVPTILQALGEIRDGLDEGILTKKDTLVKRYSNDENSLFNALKQLPQDYVSYVAHVKEKVDNKYGPASEIGTDFYQHHSAAITKIQAQQQRITRILL